MLQRGYRPKVAAAATDKSGFGLLLGAFPFLICQREVRTIVVIFLNF
jgi:hypothetical protein